MAELSGVAVEVRGTLSEVRETVTRATEVAAVMAGLLGRHHRVTGYEVGREKIREYARAVQDSHPAITAKTPPTSWETTG